MLIFSNIIIFVVLIILTHVVHPFVIGAIILISGFFLKIYVVAALMGYFLDTVFLTGRDTFFIYQNTIIFVILVVIAQFIRKSVVR